MKMRSQLRPQRASGSGDEVAAAALPATRITGGTGGSGGGGSSNPTAIAASSCQDCGNKAKRDCAHNRCRTCCKSRGFHCPTHVKSTWVPVSRRRQRLHQHLHHHHRLSLLDPEADHHHFFPLSRSLSGLRDISPASPGGMEGGGGGGHLPTEFNTTATFRCVRVSSADNLLDQCAYQTSVNIGGHLFKGILYDQGPVGAVFGGGSASGVGGGGDSSSSEHQIPHHHFLHRHLHLQQPNVSGDGGGGSGGGGVNLLYPPPPTSSLYPAVPFNAFMTPGMQFFPHPRP